MLISVGQLKSGTKLPVCSNPLPGENTSARGQRPSTREERVVHARVRGALHISRGVVVNSKAI